MGRPAKNISNQMFGDLLAVERVGSVIKTKRALWRCICQNDGNEIVADYNDLYKGHRKTCGKGCRTLVHDLVGQKFNHLTVLHRQGSNDANACWMCECDCEAKTHIVVRADRLISGNTKSCGHLNAPGGPSSAGVRTRKAPGTAVFTNLYGSYRRSADRRGLPFNISYEEFKDLAQKDCHYCGAPPGQIRGGGEKTRYHETFIYTGVDRVDSKLGYEMSNVVPACGNCNRAKSDLTLDKFLAIIHRIAARHPLPQEAQCM